ncbi:hypothetical protein [Natrinema salifodinae]|uniref:hypothetical protein n=1 Tax=Natrinema salifodinae TaxID=1202768 RepID=UPI001364B886|nr:hypothetical protein [Natrinema salifodinae]
MTETHRRESPGGTAAATERDQASRSAASAAADVAPVGLTLQSNTRATSSVV